MSKKSKIIIGALICSAVLLFALYFVLGDKKKEFTIAFDSSGGTSVPSQIVKENEKATKPTNPTKDKYNFIRWEYENKEYDFNKEVSSNMTLKAIWEEVQPQENFYDIEFVVNGETKKMSLSKVTIQDLEALGFEEKDGYELVWYVNDEVYDFTEPLALTENMTITGKYVKTTLFTVKFDTDGAGTVNSQKVKQNETATEPEAITKYGYIFDGWYLGNAKYDFATPVTKNITLVAKWKEDATVPRYDITFDSDGGSKVDKQRVIENEMAKEPKAPTKAGYKFLGWYLGENKYDFKTKVTDNVTLKAKWEKIIQYTVTFDKDNGTPNETKTVNAGDKVTKPTDPKKDGYKFSTWVYENSAFDFNTPITADITLTASYTPLPKYTITFDTKGGSEVASQSVYEGGKVTKPSDPTKADNDFDGWYVGNTNYDFSKAVTGDLTIEAHWKAKVYEYKMTATHPDNYSNSEYILKLYRNGSEIEFSSIIYGGSQEYPYHTVSEKSLKGMLNGSSLRVKLTNGNIVTATIEYR